MTKTRLQEILSDYQRQENWREYTDEQIISAIQELCESVMLKKVKCQHNAHIEPCNDERVVAKNNTIDEILTNLKKVGLVKE